MRPRMDSVGWSQSMSKKWKYREARPFSSTSTSIGLSPDTAMWLGTTSWTQPRPSSLALAARASKSSRLPSSGLRLRESHTS